MYFHDKPISTDNIYYVTPTIDYGSTYSNLFVGTKSLVSDIYVMKTYNKFVNTLEDKIRTWGAMSKLISNIDK